MTSFRASNQERLWPAPWGICPSAVSDGSLATLRDLDGIRKIYTHINNTNPILNEQSSERRAVQDAGWEVAWDGLEITI